MVLDPITAVGIASSFAQLIEIGFKIGHRIRLFTSAQVELPSTLRDAGDRLDLVIKSLVRLQNDSDAATELSNFLIGLKRRMESLDEIIDKYLPKDDDSTTTKLVAAVRSLGKDRKVEKLSEELQSDVIYLTGYLTARMSVAALTSSGGTGRHLEGRKLFRIPYKKVSHFVGREALLNELSASMDEPATGHTAPVIVLQGMGGQGKTQTALEYCHRAWRRERYKAVMWLNATSESSLVKSLANLAELFKEPGQILIDNEARAQFVKRVLESWSESFLLVFDNYDEPEQFRNVHEYFPAADQGRILFTTRDPDTWRLGKQIKVDGMLEIEGLDLLFDVTGVEETPDNLSNGKDIIRRLGYLPLAIDQAGAYIHDSDGEIGLDEFLEFFEQETTDILESTPAVWEYLDLAKESQREHAKSVFSTWELSLSRLPLETDDGKKIVEFLSVLGFFHPESIPEDLFRIYLLRNPDPTLHPPWFTLFQDSSGTWSSKKFRDWAMRLRKLSLITGFSRTTTSDDSSTPNTTATKPKLKSANSSKTSTQGNLQLALHPLVSDWLRLRPTDPTARQTAFRTFSAIMAQNCAEYHVTTWLLGLTFRIPVARKNAFLQHLSQYERRLIGYMGDDTDALPPAPTLMPNIDKDVACAELCLGLFLTDANLFDRALVIYEWLLRVCDARPGVLKSRIHGWVAERILNDMAFVGNHLGAFERGQSLEKHFAEKYGSESLEYLEVLLVGISMGVDTYKYEEVARVTRECYNKLEAMMAEEERAGRKPTDLEERDDDDDTEWSMWEEANSLWEQYALELAISLWELDEPETLEESAKILERVCKAGTKSKDVKQGSTKWNWRMWILANSMTDHVGQKGNMVTELLYLVEKELGKENFTYFATQQELAELLQDQGKYVEAEDLIRECIKNTRDYPPREDSDLYMLGQLRNSLMKQSKIEEAIETHLQGLRICESRKNPEHWTYWEWKYWYCELLLKKGDLDLAEKSIKECINATKDITVRNFDIEMLTCLRQILVAQKRFTEAVELTRKIVDMVKDRDVMTVANKRAWVRDLANLINVGLRDPREAERVISQLENPNALELNNRLVFRHSIDDIEMVETSTSIMLDLLNCFGTGLEEITEPPLDSKHTYASLAQEVCNRLKKKDTPQRHHLATWDEAEDEDEDPVDRPMGEPIIVQGNWSIYAFFLHRSLTSLRLGDFAAATHYQELYKSLFELFKEKHKDRFGIAFKAVESKIRIMLELKKSGNHSETGMRILGDMISWAENRCRELLGVDAPETRKLESLSELRNSVIKSLDLELLGASLSMKSLDILPAHYRPHASTDTLVSNAGQDSVGEQGHVGDHEGSLEMLSGMDRQPKMFALQRRPTDLARMAMEMEVPDCTRGRNT
ncbi:hypothetical protein BT63DRAFT_412193 [Microthyrium microscopicum]|uniref:NB-ARC domain-containing protein n=1 Tax=Microthyrium microscopicum TaxID=703497 RepID=A0A6A6UI49_9PEZI|nr:hypothetical protein BT63DRAFT_412193 [Microthyrium microscopicum]